MARLGPRIARPGALSANKLTKSIPAGLGNLFALMYLDISNNNLTGSIPSSISSFADFPSLGYLYEAPYLLSVPRYKATCWGIVLSMRGVVRP
ncbi:unnamed protein product [Closterium sp. NIES-65]|nr:unnamed protein product [Closterium sp. NIES-65]